mgnify:CR=1 FL=1
MIMFAESLGGTETLITYPTTQTHEDTPLDIKEKLGITDCFLRMFSRNRECKMISSQILTVQ